MKDYNIYRHRLACEKGAKTLISIKVFNKESEVIASANLTEILFRDEVAYELENVWVTSSLRSRGNATRMVETLLAYAIISEGVDVFELLPEPFTRESEVALIPKPKGLNMKELIKMYQELGFKMKEGSDKMIAEPEPMLIIDKDFNFLE